MAGDTDGEALSGERSTTPGSGSTSNTSSERVCREEGGAGDGLGGRGSCLRVIGPPVPLAKAQSLMREAVHDLRPVPGAMGVSFLRLEVGVTDIEDDHDALVWLRAQPGVWPKVFFRVPDSTLVMAGLGAAHVVSGRGTLGASNREALMSLPRGIAYYGASRFDPHFARPSPEWERFGGYYFVLPVVEVIRHDSTGAFSLACNLRFSSATDFPIARASALASLQRRCVHVDDYDDHQAGCLLPAPLPRAEGEDSTASPAWREGIERALGAMRTGQYRKVVLARSVELTFPLPPPPLDMVLRLHDHYGYLFCLQLDDETAFLGCTPEQLVKVS